MKKYLFPALTFLLLVVTNAIAQNSFKSIHQEESEKYNAIGKDADYYQQNNIAKVMLDDNNAKAAATCTLQRLSAQETA